MFLGARAFCSAPTAPVARHRLASRGSLRSVRGTPIQSALSGQVRRTARASKNFSAGPRSSFDRSISVREVILQPAVHRGHQRSVGRSSIGTFRSLLAAKSIRTRVGKVHFPGAALLPNLLAAKIMFAAAGGERDPQKLKAQALGMMDVNLMSRS